MVATGMSVISTRLILIRCSSRSRGPSNTGSWTRHDAGRSSPPPPPSSPPPPSPCRPVVDLHRRAHLLHGLLRPLARPARPVRQDVEHHVAVARQLLAPPPHRLQGVGDPLRDHVLF